VIVFFVVLALIILAILTALASRRAPSVITLSETNRVAGAGGVVLINFSVTVTYATPRAITVTEEVTIREDDRFFDEALISGVAVTVPAGGTTGSAPFSLVCQPGLFATNLIGLNATSYWENPHEVYGEYGRFLRSNIYSNTLNVSCQE
jgi:hypothetical protein